MKKSALISSIDGGALEKLYGADTAPAMAERYKKAIEEFSSFYGECGELCVFSVPGRSEISGNHTDHNHGKVLAAAINLDIIAVVSPATDGKIRIKSEGFDEDRVDISALSPEAYKKYSSASLIAGMCDGFIKNDYKIGGFCAYTTSNVYKGSGLSSSAAFEVMIGNILNHLYNSGIIPPANIAKIAQYSENVFFGKPCGLMDQTACAVGGFVYIDFADPKNPVIDKMPFDLSAHGYSLCITNTGGNHADLNEDYASVPGEMKALAAKLGREVLRGVSYEEIISAIPSLRESVGDRAIMRALHFVAENGRVEAQAEALRKGDLDAFLCGVRESGRSSAMWLQNVFTTKNVSEQGVSLALCLSELFLTGCGKPSASRVHGGGFAGTMQAFVPTEFVPTYKAKMDSVFGAGACLPLKVRADGAIKVF